MALLVIVTGLLVLAVIIILYKRFVGAGDKTAPEEGIIEEECEEANPKSFSKLWSWNPVQFGRLNTGASQLFKGGNERPLSPGSGEDIVSTH